MNTLVMRFALGACFIVMLCAEIVPGSALKVGFFRERGGGYRCAARSPPWRGVTLSSPRRPRSQATCGSANAQPLRRTRVRRPRLLRRPSASASPPRRGPAAGRDDRHDPASRLREDGSQWRRVPALRLDVLPRLDDGQQPGVRRIAALTRVDAEDRGAGEAALGIRHSRTASTIEWSPRPDACVSSWRKERVG